MRKTYALHGLTVGSEVDLSALLASSPRCGAPDVAIRWGAPREVPGAAPPGRLLVDLDLPGWRSSVAETEAGYLLRFHSRLDCEISRDRASVTLHADPRADPGLASTLAPGNVLALLLALRGQSVLHASAVEAGGAAIAFLGASGMGKTTLAARLCAAGGRLVSDDALRVEADGERAWCHRGTNVLRLRASAAAALAGSFPSGSVTRGPDERTLVRAEPAEHAELPLAAIVVPERSDDGAELELERLTGRHALVELLRYPRTIGWLTGDPLGGQLTRLAAVARLVPVYRARLAWGPPFHPGTAERLAAEVGLDV